ncbi:hypothetical protein KUTeg_001109 [Tegillarca granosa]|uniref:DUF7869 domain-containing protein n=1 Tax=Tegillarca granosa TaxID=220873 RepID=A0ABQ9FVS0_TEGGR|nr:hypothetical protein KUTeg_001109 [Tegillarca granosa]
MREVFEIDIPTSKYILYYYSDESDIDIQDGITVVLKVMKVMKISNEMSNRSEGRPKGTKRARDKDENESGKAYPTKKQSRMEDFASWLENGGVKIIDKPGRTGGRPGTDSESALAWLHFYAIKYAEQQPDQVKLHLPPCLTKGSVYMMYTEEMTEKGIKIISISHFYLLWRKCLNFISIPQQSTFSKCDICTQIKTKLSSTKDKAIRAALQKLRHNHLRKQRFSVWLKTHSATTLPKLMNLWEQCFTPKPTGILTENVYDVAGWLQGHINPISGHSKPHTFRITKENDKVKLVFKKWTNDAVWIESKGNKELLENIPSGYPKKLEKISDANIDAKKLENDVNKVLRDYVTVEEDKNWWDSFFESLEKSNENEEGEQWMLDDIIEATEQASLTLLDRLYPFTKCCSVSSCMVH